LKKDPKEMDNVIDNPAYSNILNDLKTSLKNKRAESELNKL